VISITNPSGGTAPYSYVWDGPGVTGSTSATISNLCIGDYTVTITDSEGICEYVETVTMTGAPPLNPVITTNSPVCEGQTLDFTLTLSNPATGYSWSGPGGFTSTVQNPTRPAATPAMSGTYSVTVSDSYGCSALASTDVVVNAVTPVSITSGTPYCEGETIQLNATTVAGATYSWSGPGVFSSAVEDPQITNCVITDGGTYTVVVTDANSCVASANHTVVVNPGIAANFTAIDPLCYQQPTGQLTVNVTSGTPTYTYTWSNGSNVNPLTGCTGGINYCVTINDAAGCSLSMCHTLTDPADIVASATTVPTECGYLDGEIILNIAGGAGGYNANWTEGLSGLHITGLHPGNYTGTITDANGCTEVITTNVGFFGGGVVSITELQAIKCFGDDNAVLTSSMTGGFSPFDYQWSVAGQTSPNLAGIGAGQYSVTIEDTYGCTGSATIDVNQPDPVTILIEKTDVPCRGGNTGTATANVTGGIFPYIYAWDHGPTSSHISSLSAGTYSLMVTDLNGCVANEFVVIEQPEKSLGVILTTTGVTCTGRYDGTAMAEGDGGTPPYNIYWTQYGTVIASGSQVQSFRSGNYAVEVFDANNCSEEVNFVISEPAELLVSTEMSTVTCKGYNDGLIAVLVSGGSFPYNIAWSNGDTLAVADSLRAGQYFVTITDNSNCVRSLGILMTENPRLCLGIPDAFTPNGDGINDTWEIEYIEMYPGSYVNVFNRWGQHIYQGTPGSDFWDGKFNDNFVPAGAYQYIIDLRNGMEPFTGVVVVVY
jgi:gliding motility-associated-like protein